MIRYLCSGVNKVYEDVLLTEVLYFTLFDSSFWHYIESVPVSLQQEIFIKKEELNGQVLSLNSYAFSFQQYTLSQYGQRRPWFFYYKHGVEVSTI